MKEMYKVSEDIDKLDPSLNTGHGGTRSNTLWACGDSGSSGPTGVGKCVKSSSGESNLKAAFTSGSGKASEIATPVEKATADNLAGVMTGTVITRDQKGKISSAFAKAHEGNICKKTHHEENGNNDADKSNSTTHTSKRVLKEQQSFVNECSWEHRCSWVRGR